MSYGQIKTVDEAVTKIIDLEIKTGERFSDYFMHDTVDDGAWAYWLLGKGYVKHGNNVIMELLASDGSVDQEFLYQVYNENDDDVHLSQENMIKNIELIAEFLVDSPKYLEELNKFLENKDE